MGKIKVPGITSKALLSFYYKEISCRLLKVPRTHSSALYVVILEDLLEEVEGLALEEAVDDEIVVAEEAANIQPELAEHILELLSQQLAVGL
jgi:hypothetical protein